MNTEITNKQRPLDEVVASLLSYSFEEIGWNYTELTATERELVSEEEFERLKEKFRKG